VVRRAPRGCGRSRDCRVSRDRASFDSALSAERVGLRFGFAIASAACRRPERGGGVRLRLRQPRVGGDDRDRRRAQQLFAIGLGLRSERGGDRCIGPGEDVAREEVAGRGVGAADVPAIASVLSTIRVCRAMCRAHYLPVTPRTPASTAVRPSLLHHDNAQETS
jgi:hypothetical protein